MGNRKSKVKQVEFHLFRYRQYQVAINNLERQLNFIMPDLTANYTAMEGTTGTFVVNSSTERAAIDRIESRRAMNILEEKNRYVLILNCIDAALASLPTNERDFVERRYFRGQSVVDIAVTDNLTPSAAYRMRDNILDKLLISLSAIDEL